MATSGLVPQMNPVDPTGYLCVDVTVLRNGLLSCKAKLAPMIDHDVQDLALLREAIEKAIEEIDKTLVEGEKVRAERSMNL